MDAVGSHTGGVSMFTRSLRQLSSARTNRTRARSPSHRQPVGFPLSTGGVCEFPTVNRRVAAGIICLSEVQGP